MNEDLPNYSQPLEQEWQAPPPPFDNTPPAEPAQMSEVGTLGSIFFEPGATFEDLRRKPRFLMAGLITIILFTAFNVLFIQKVGFEEIVKARINSSERAQQMPAEQKQAIIEQQSSPVVKAISYVAGPIFILIFFLVGSLIYWLGVKAMGGETTFSRALSVWVYASFPPSVVSMLANILVLFLKSTDDIDITTAQSGLIKASPAFFMDERNHKVLAAVLGTFDLFYIWGWILAAIGLRIVGKISTGAAVAIVAFVALFNVAVRVLGAFF